MAAPAQSLVDDGLVTRQRAQTRDLRECGARFIPASHLFKNIGEQNVLVSYIIALALLVLTKENSFFVWVALVVLLVTNRWLQFGTVTRELVIATLLGPLLGVVVLIFLAGGMNVFVQSYQLSVGKNFQLHYAILTGDGPWYRYLVDLLLVSPIVLILALGTIFRLNRTMKPELSMSIFIAASYLFMCNVKYGMNLRYANMWDLPLRFLAFSEIVALASWAKISRCHHRRRSCPAHGDRVSSIHRPGSALPALRTYHARFAGGASDLEVALAHCTSLAKRRIRCFQNELVVVIIEAGEIIANPPE